MQEHIMCVLPNKMILTLCSEFVSTAKRLRVMRRSELPQDLVSVVPLQFV
jgi:hypothetical protein